MTYDQFTSVIRSYFPTSKPEALPVWQEFVEENLSDGHTVRVEEVSDKAAREKWYDVLCGGFFLVREKMGQAAAISVINVSCEHCCLYPGEMVQAAVCLQNGESGMDIMEKIRIDEIESQQPFFPEPPAEILARLVQEQGPEMSGATIEMQ